MDPMSTGLVAMQIVGGIGGLLGASAARKRAMQARERAMQELMRQMAEDEDLQQRGNARSIYQTTGVMGDALRAQGGALGSALSQAGVYNSSATAGALQKQAQANAAVLADLAARSAYELQQLRNKNKQFITAQKLGYAQQDYEEAKAGETSVIAGITQALQAISAANSQKATKAPASPPAASPNTANAAQQNAGNISQYLRSSTGMKTSQTYGPAGQGNYNWTLPQMPNRPWWYRPSLFG